MDKFQEYVNANRERFIAELQDFCRQPSVAAQNWGISEMADKVLARLQKLGARELSRWKAARRLCTPKSAVLLRQAQDGRC